MINIYRYRGHKNLREDSETKKLEVPTGEILEIKGLEVSGLQVNALIDTGASFTAVSSKIADELNLIQTGFQKISSIHAEQVRERRCRARFFLLCMKINEKI